MDQCDNAKYNVVNEDFILKVLNEKYGDGIKLESFEVRPGSEKGENFIGDLLAVDVKVSGHSLKENDKSLYWMVKTLKPGPEGQGEGFAQILRLFDREEAFYAGFLRDMDKYVKKDALRTVPFIYSSNEKGKEVLVFEHLKPHGFRDPINKKLGFDDEHIRHSLQWLARLHGSSHILYSKYPGGYSAWAKENFYSEPAKFSKFKEMSAMMADNYLKTLKTLQNGSENDEYVQKFESEYVRVFKDTNPFEKIENEIYSSRSDFKVLCHGDTWFNNIMFKYDTDQKKIVDTIFLDMQIVYSGNVGTDLAHFLCTCVTYDVLTKELDNYLQYYYNCLKTFILELEPSMTQIPFSFQDLKQDFKQSALIGFFVALEGFPVILAEKEHLTDLDFNKVDMNDKEDAEKFVEEFSSYSSEIIFKNKLIYERMIGVIKFLVELNTFDYLN